MKILGVSGSLQKESSNLRLLHDLRARMPANVEMVIFDGIGRIPAFNPDHLSYPPLPEAVTHWKTALTTCKAVLFASPEYGHSLPGALKNAIDWVYASGEFYHKPVALTAAVRDAERGLRGLEALHQTLSAAGADIFYADTVLYDEAIEQRLDEVKEAILRLN